MAYILGFFAADGTMIRTTRNTYYIAIQVIDKDVIYYIRESLGSNHTINVRKRFGNEHDLYRLQIGSREMYQDLENLGFTSGKTKQLSMPKIPKKFFYDFVRGYFDGDGNVWVGNVHKDRKTMTRVIQVTFTSCSKSFLLMLQKEMKAFGINGGSLYSPTSKSFSRLSFVNRNASKIYKMMYNIETPFCLIRKKAVFDKYFAAVVQR